MIAADYRGAPTFYGVCPQCHHDYMRPLWDTEWTNGTTRTVDMLCEWCAHRETRELPIERKRTQRNAK